MSQTEPKAPHDAAAEIGFGIVRPRHPSDGTKIYLARAAKCEDRAATASDETAKKRFREAARLWRYIAEQAEYLACSFPRTRSPDEVVGGTALGR